MALLVGDIVASFTASTEGFLKGINTVVAKLDEITAKDYRIKVSIEGTETAEAVAQVSKRVEQAAVIVEKVVDTVKKAVSAAVDETKEILFETAKEMGIAVEDREASISILLDKFFEKAQAQADEFILHVREFLDDMFRFIEDFLKLIGDRVPSTLRPMVDLVINRLLGPSKESVLKLIDGLRELLGVVFELRQGTARTGDTLVSQVGLADTIVQSLRVGVRSLSLVTKGLVGTSFTLFKGADAFFKLTRPTTHLGKAAELIDLIFVAINKLVSPAENLRNIFVGIGSAFGTVAGVVTSVFNPALGLLVLNTSLITTGLAGLNVLFIKVRLGMLTFAAKLGFGRAQIFVFVTALRQMAVSLLRLSKLAPGLVKLIAPLAELGRDKSFNIVNAARELVAVIVQIRDELVKLREMNFGKTAFDQIQQVNGALVKSHKVFSTVAVGVKEVGRRLTAGLLPVAEVRKNFSTVAGDAPSILQRAVVGVKEVGRRLTAGLLPVAEVEKVGKEVQTRMKQMLQQFAPVLDRAAFETGKKGFGGFLAGLLPTQKNLEAQFKQIGERMKLRAEAVAEVERRTQGAIIRIQRERFQEENKVLETRRALQKAQALVSNLEIKSIGAATEKERERATRKLQTRKEEAGRAREAHDAAVQELKDAEQGHSAEARRRREQRKLADERLAVIAKTAQQQLGELQLAQRRDRIQTESIDRNIKALQQRRGEISQTADRVKDLDRELQHIGGNADKVASQFRTLTRSDLWKTLSIELRSMDKALAGAALHAGDLRTLLELFTTSPKAIARLTASIGELARERLRKAGVLLPSPEQIASTGEIIRSEFRKIIAEAAKISPVAGQLAELLVNLKTKTHELTKGLAGNSAVATAQFKQMMLTMALELTQGPMSLERLQVYAARVPKTIGDEIKKNYRSVEAGLEALATDINSFIVPGSDAPNPKGVKYQTAGQKGGSTYVQSFGGSLRKSAPTYLPKRDEWEMMMGIPVIPEIATEAGRKFDQQFAMSLKEAIDPRLLPKTLLGTRSTWESNVTKFFNEMGQTIRDQGVAKLVAQTAANVKHSFATVLEPALVAATKPLRDRIVKVLGPELSNEVRMSLVGLGNIVQSSVRQLSTTVASPLRIFTLLVQKRFGEAFLELPKLAGRTIANVAGIMQGLWRTFRGATVIRETVRGFKELKAEIGTLFKATAAGLFRGVKGAFSFLGGRAEQRQQAREQTMAMVAQANAALQAQSRQITAAQQTAKARVRIEEGVFQRFAMLARAHEQKFIGFRFIPPEAEKRAERVAVTAGTATGTALATATVTAVQNVLSPGLKTVIQDALKGVRMLMRTGFTEDITAATRTLGSLLRTSIPREITGKLREVARREMTNAIAFVFRQAHKDVSIGAEKIPEMIASRLRERAKVVTGAMRSVLQLLADHLPSSPPKIGPIAGNYLFDAGRKAIHMFSFGILKEEGFLATAVSRVLQAGFLPLTAPAGLLFAAVTGGIDLIHGIGKAFQHIMNLPIVNFLKHVTEGIVETGRAAERLGVPVEKFDAFAKAAEFAGVQASQLESVFITLQRSLREALTDPLGDTAARLQRLGVDLDKYRAGLIDEIDIYKQLSSAYAEGTISQQDLQSALDLTASTFSNLKTLFGKGGQEIDRLTAKAAAMGGLVSPEMLRRANEFNEQTVELKHALEGIKREIAEALLPIVLRTFRVVTTWFEQNKPAIFETIEILGSMLETLFNGLNRKLVEWFNNSDLALTEVSRLIGAVMQGFVRVGMTVLEHLGSLGPAFFDVAKTIVEPILEFLLYSVTKVWLPQMMDAIGVSLRKFVPDIMNQIDAMTTVGFEGMADHFALEASRVLGFADSRMSAFEVELARRRGVMAGAQDALAREEQAARERQQQEYERRAQVFERDLNIEIQLIPRRFQERLETLGDVTNDFLADILPVFQRAGEALVNAIGVGPEAQALQDDFNRLIVAAQRIQFQAIEAEEQAAEIAGEIGDRLAGTARGLADSQALFLQMLGRAEELVAKVRGLFTGLDLVQFPGSVEARRQMAEASLEMERLNEELGVQRDVLTEIWQREQLRAELRGEQAPVLSEEAAAQLQRIRSIESQIQSAQRLQETYIGMEDRLRDVNVQAQILASVPWDFPGKALHQAALELEKIQLQAEVTAETLGQTILQEMQSIGADLDAAVQGSTVDYLKRLFFIPEGASLEEVKEAYVKFVTGSFEASQETIKTEFAPALKQAIAGALSAGFMSVIKGEATWIQALDKMMTDLFDSLVNDLVTKLSEGLAESLTKELEKAFKFAGNMADELATAVVAGIAFLISALVDSGKEALAVTQEGLESVVEQTEAVRGIISGETTIAIKEIGDQLSDALVPTNEILMDIRSLLAAGAGAYGGGLQAAVAGASAA